MNNPIRAMVNGNFISSFKLIQERAFQINKENGFWDKEIEVGTRIALCHSELSELLESERKGIPQDDKLPMFTNSEVEAADTIIRLMDMAEGYNWRLAEAILAKLELNKTRGWKHGGKKF